MNYWAGGNRGNFGKLSDYMFSAYPRYNGDQVWESIFRRIDNNICGVGDYTYFAGYVFFLEKNLQLNGCIDSGLL